MHRSVPVRPWWRATLLVAVIIALALPAAVAGATEQQQAARRTHATEPQRDPDERAAGGERVGNEDATGAMLLLTPSHLEVEPGARLRLVLSVIGAEDLRRLPATVRFDPAVLEPVDVRPGSAWRDGPPPLLLYDAGRPGDLVIGLALLDRQQPGVSGSAELLELEFRAVGRGNAALRIERFAALGAGGRAQVMRAAAPEIVVR
jgi:hypothetical protein